MTWSGPRPYIPKPGNRSRKPAAELVLERCPLTRFSYAWGPLTRYPGCSVEQVRRVVQDECAELSGRLLTVRNDRQENLRFSGSAS